MAAQACGAVHERLAGARIKETKDLAGENGDVHAST
jgi:hypothetical protein